MYCCVATKLSPNFHLTKNDYAHSMSDLNHACRYATNIIAMRDGAIIAHGSPPTTVTERLVEDVFGLPCMIIPDPVSGTPLIVPKVKVRAACIPITPDIPEH
ncbi:ABC superfamily (atp bind), enterobactin transporter (plasmid) [Agrobacterium tumefaciens]|nr:ABC superfamily (atp bind), enterobactin transporter [Agrobacterium tumefaciens]